MVGPLKGLRSTKKIDNDLWLSSGGKKAFDLAKEILSRVPVLSNLDWSKEFFVETDASQFGVGAVLFQKGTEGEVNMLDDVNVQIIYGNNTHSLNSLFFFPSFYSLLLLLCDQITFSKCTLLRLRPPLLLIH